MSELYHYTTVAGFLGMLEVTGSKKDSKSEPTTDLTMRATHCNYMNDRSEFDFGVNLCRKAICEYENEHGIPEELSLGQYMDDKSYDSDRFTFLFNSAYADKSEYGYPYLISFSHVKDSIPMWGMYAANGGGIALVFDRDELEAQFRDTKYRDCLYCNEGDTSLIMQDINDKYKGLKKPNDDIDAELAETFKKAGAFARIQRIYRAIGPFVKHKAFEYEQEFRIIVSKPNPIHYVFGTKCDTFGDELISNKSDNILFREKEGMIIPYVEQQIPLRCLKEIIIGPTADFERLKDAITVFLLNRDIKIVEITRSEVPYRG